MVEGFGGGGRKEVRNFVVRREGGRMGWNKVVTKVRRGGEGDE